MDNREAFERDLRVVDANPQDTNLLIRFCVAYEAHFADAVIEYLKRRLTRPAPPALRIYEYSMIAMLVEKQQRRAHSLSPERGRSFDDIQFNHAAQYIGGARTAAEQFLASKPNSKGALTLLGDILVSAGDFEAAGVALHKLRELGDRSTTAATFLNASFHAALPDEYRSFCGRLPAVSWVTKEPTDCRRALYVACDYNYFLRFGSALLRSLDFQNEASIVLVLHVMDATTEEAAEIVSFLSAIAKVPVSVSTEWSGLRSSPLSEAARVYYHAVRFVRLCQFAESNADCTAFLLDADMVFNRSPAHIFDEIANCDVALPLLSARLETRNKILAACVGVAPSGLGRNYLRHVAGYLGFCQRSGFLTWGIDQAALYAVLVNQVKSHPFAVAPVSEEIFDTSVGEDRVMWPGKVAPGSPEEARLAVASRRWVPDPRK